MFHSLPYALLKTNHIPFTAEIAKKDKEVLDGLEAVGFLLEKGPHGAGLLPKYLENGGGKLSSLSPNLFHQLIVLMYSGYYIDVGASPLIASGGIKIKSGHGVAQVLPHGVQLDGGTKLDADEIVFATGYTSMVQSAAKILGEDAVEGVQDVWGVDKDTGEVRGMWKRAHPERSLWFMGGNLAITRWFSRGLALGIAGVEAGLV